MLSRERYAPPLLPHPSAVELPTGDGRSVWGDTSTGQLSLMPPKQCRDFRGGLLCDEPGLGKTVTAIGLILRSKGNVPRANFNGRAEASFSHLQDGSGNPAATWIGNGDGGRKKFGFYTVVEESANGSASRLSTVAVAPGVAPAVPVPAAVTAPYDAAYEDTVPAVASTPAIDPSDDTIAGDDSNNNRGGGVDINYGNVFAGRRATRQPARANHSSIRYSLVSERGISAIIEASTSTSLQMNVTNGGVDDKAARAKKRLKTEFYDEQLPLLLPCVGSDRSVGYQDEDSLMAVDTPDNIQAQRHPSNTGGKENGCREDGSLEGEQQGSLIQRTLCFDDDFGDEIYNVNSKSRSTPAPVHPSNLSSGTDTMTKVNNVSCVGSSFDDTDDAHDYLIQCDLCSKWRRLPARYSHIYSSIQHSTCQESNEHGEDFWCCYMHPVPGFQSCNIRNEDIENGEHLTSAPGYVLLRCIVVVVGF